MTDDFGDATPEDAWDPDDQVDELVDNIRRRIAAIITLRAVDEIIDARLGWMIADLGHIVTRIRAGLYERQGGP